MKVLIINDHLKFGGGTSTALLNEIKILESKGNNIYQLCFDENVPNLFGENNVYNFNEISRFKRKFGKFFGNKKIDKFLKETINNIEPDYIHIHLISKYPAEVLRAVEGYNVIKTLHGPNLFCASGWGGLKDGSPCEMGIGIKCYKNRCVPLINTLCYMYLQRRYKESLANNVDMFLCPSTFIQKAAHRYGLSNLEYAPLFVFDNFHETSDVTKDHKDIYELLYVGAIDVCKGVDQIIESMKSIRQVRDDIHVTIVGSGKYQWQLIDEIDKHELSSMVDFIGQVENDKLMPYFKRADVFLMPSLWQEQFGLVGLESLLSKTPCIATNVGGIPEWMKDEEFGFIIEPNDTTALISAINNILDPSVDRQSMGEKGREYILNTFSYDKFSDKLIDIFKV